MIVAAVVTVLFIVVVC